jgi:glucosyl-dolichyl phosphate glucuronosyltransferase
MLRQTCAEHVATFPMPSSRRTTEAVDLSVVVCTLNRAPLLERGVNSLLAQETQDTPFEVLVVDNGSSDDTATRINGLAHGSIPVRYVREPRLGLSLARNAGIEHATGVVVAFLDDDAEADARWVDWLASVFRTDPAAGAAGGRTVVRWPDTRPEWMSDRIEGYYGKCDYGDRRRPLFFPEYPFGSNMAIRRDLLVALNGFRTDLGAHGSDLMAGEETDLFARLHKQQIRVVYEPRAVVHHWAAPERVTRRWTLRRAFKHGASTALMSSPGSRTLVRGSGKLLRALWLAGVGGVSTCAAWARGSDSATTVSRGASAAYWAGYVRGAVIRAALTIRPIDRGQRE